MVLLKKTKWYFRVLPYTLALVNVCALPFWPVVNFKMCVLLVMTNQGLILTSVCFDGESLGQQLILTACEIAALLYRLKFVLPFYGEYFKPGQDVIWAIFALIIVGLMSSDRTSDFKEAFEQKFILQKKNDDFEDLFNSFPDAALIIEDNQNDPENENQLADESARRLDVEICEEA